MDKNENLRKHVEFLCEILNKNGFKDGGLSWFVGIDPKSAFGGGICFDKKAFHFLKNNGHLDKKICWKCGNQPINKDYSFTDGFDNSVNYNICKSCFNTGKKIQNLREGKDSKNCYIATVCYEDIDAPEVEILRKFRDEKLVNNFIGAKIIFLYYKISPTIANKMKNTTNLNRLVKMIFLNPIVNILNKKQ